MLAGLSPREATEFLIDKARQRARGGGDNLSLVIVRVEALAAPSASPLAKGLTGKA